MNKYVNSLRTNLDHITREVRISRNDLIKVLLDTRQLIEVEHLKSKFELTNFFLNWCFHPSISETSAAHNMLLVLSKTCVTALVHEKTEEANKENTRKFIDATENILSFSRLRLEFRQLFMQYSLPVFLFTNKSNWDAFAKVIVQEVFDKPVTFPGIVLSATSSDQVPSRYKKTYRILEEIRTGSLANEKAQIIGLKIIKGSECFPNMYCIELSTQTKVKYVIQLKGKEAASDFVENA